MKRTLIAALAAATLVTPAFAGAYGPFDGYTMGMDQSTPTQVETPVAKAMFAQPYGSEAGQTLGQGNAGPSASIETPAAKALFIQPSGTERGQTQGLTLAGQPTHHETAAARAMFKSLYS